MAPHSSTLAWRIPWTEEPGRLQSMGPLRVGHDWATSLSLFTFMHWVYVVKSLLPTTPPAPLTTQFIGNSWNLLKHLTCLPSRHHVVYFKVWLCAFVIVYFQQKQKIKSLKIKIKKEMATHTSVLAWRIPGTGEPGGLTSMGSYRVRHDWSDLAFFLL